MSVVKKFTRTGKRLDQVEKALDRELNPLQVNINWFGDSPLPKDPPVRNGVAVKYVRYQEQT